jgi:diacylglycerol kinase family enzyme
MMTMVPQAVRAADPADKAEHRPGRCFLVINPGSRHGHSRAIAERYLALLAEGTRAEASGGRAGTIDHGYTRCLDDAGTLTRRALAEGYETIVAVGGDGTINRVVSALVEAGPLSARARLGVLYSGTSPDFCRFHGIPTDPAAAAGVLLDGNARPIDVCRIEHRDAASQPRVDHYASSANIGLGAGIAARANRMRPRLGDFLGTLLASVITIARTGPRRVRLVVDGEELDVAPALNITVGKNPHLAGGLKLDVEVVPGDGQMFVFTLCGIDRAQLLYALPRIYSGRIARDPRFILRRARTVLVEPLEGTLRTEFDGDPAGWCPAEISVLPGAVRLIGARC